MRNHFYTRSLFVAFCAFFVCVSAMAETYLNPFAYRLDNMVDRTTGIPENEGKGLLMDDHYVIKYALSGPATSVIVRFWDDDNSTWSRDGGNTGTALFEFDITNKTDNNKNPCKDKGYHEYTIDFTHVIGQNPNLNMQKVRWTIDVMGGNQAEEYTTKTVKKNQSGGTQSCKFINAKEITEYKGFRYPGSVDICNNPYDYNFGVVFCTESRVTAAGDDANYVSYGQVPGVYVFGGGMERLYANWHDGNVACYGANFSEATHFLYNGTTLYARAPHRVRVSDDGRVFVSVVEGRNNILKRIKNPSNIDRIDLDGDGLFDDGGNFYEPDRTGGSYDDIFYGDNASNRGTWNAAQLNLSTSSGGKFIAAPNVGMDVRGSGSALELLLLSADMSDSRNLYPGSTESHYPGIYQTEWHLDKYSLGDKSEWGNNASTQDILELIKTNNKLPNRNELTDQLTATDGTKLGDAMLVGYDNTGLEYDPIGGCWIVQHRGNDGVAATMIHYNAVSKKIDFEEHISGRPSGGVRHNHDFTKLAVAGGYKVDSTFTYKGKQYNGQKARESYITIYSVTYNNSTGSYTFIDEAYIESNKGGFHDFAWDFADNLYAAANGTNRLMAFALPHAGITVSTPCREEYEYKMAPVHEFSAIVNPTVPGADEYATIIHERIGEEPYGHYLNNAKMDLRADVLQGCKFYQWTTYGWNSSDVNDKSLRTPTTTDGNTFLVESLTEKLEVIAEIGICVYEHEAPLAVKAQTTFPAAFVKRELDDISYSTICLPFHLESLAGTPYQGASVLELTSSTTNTDGDSRVFLNFEEVVFGTGKGMIAGKPYLIQLPKGKQLQSEEIFTDVTCPVLSGTNACGGLDVDCGNDITFHGLLNPTTFDEDEIKDKLFLTADNRLVSLYGQNSFSINGLRGYFTVSGAAQNVEFVLNLPEKVTTSIPMVNMADTLQVTKYLWDGKIYIQKGNQVYDLSGARVR